MGGINNNQIYLWKKRSLCSYPWQRQHVNVDFYKYEKKRLQDVGKWYTSLQGADWGQKLEEVYYYVVPVEMPSSWKSAIADEKDYNYVALSSLKNGLHHPLIMLVPKDKALPEEYSLIRIINPRKHYIHNKKINEVKFAIIADDFQRQDPSSVYIDVPFEKRIISKFIKENLVNDDFVASSFQPTISGSPYVANGKGGVSFSAFNPDSTFSKELIQTLKLMQPLEFTDLQFELPRRLQEGKGIPLGNFKYWVAEKTYIGRNFFRAFSTGNYDALERELIKRDTFNGEYSIACLLNPKGDGPSELLNDIISKFLKTEIMHPYDTDEIKYSDVDLTKAQKAIDEDLWLQIANQRQTQPAIIDSLSKPNSIQDQLISTWESILESLGLKKNTEHATKVYAAATYRNLTRVAQSFARDNLKNEADESLLNRSYKLFVQTSEGLINNPMIQHHAKVIIPQKFEDIKFNAIRAELSTNTMEINSLFRNCKEYFKDIYELQEFVDKLLLHGMLFEPKRGVYKWI